MSDPQASLDESASRIKTVADGIAKWWRGTETETVNNGNEDLPTPANLLKQLRDFMTVNIGDVASAVAATFGYRNDAQAAAAAAATAQTEGAIGAATVADLATAPFLAYPDKTLALVDGVGYFRRNTAGPDAWVISADRVHIERDARRGDTAAVRSAVDLWKHNGVGDVVPLLVDSAGVTLVGYRISTNRLIGVPTVPADQVQSVIGSTLPQASTWRQSAVPGGRLIIAADLMRELLSIDLGTGEIVGKMPMQAAPYVDVPLPEKYRLSAVARVAKQRTGQSLSVGGAALAWSIKQFYNVLTFLAGVKATKAGSIGDNPGVNGEKLLVEDNLSNNTSEVARGETGLMAATDEMIERHIRAGESYPTYFACTAGRVGYTIQQLQLNQPWGQVIKDQIDASKALAATASQSLDWLPVSHIHGESAEGQNQETFKAATRTYRSDVAAYINRGPGKDVAFLITQTPRAPVHRSQWELLQEDGFYLSTALYDLPSIDGTHLTAFGYHKMGRREGRADSDIEHNRVPRNIWPIAAARVGARIYWRFRVPQGPLWFDTTDMPQITNFGFGVTVDGVLADVQSVSVANGDTIIIDLVTTPGDSAVVEARYALDYQIGGLGWSALNRGGNCMDSTPDYFYYENKRYAMPYPMPHCYQAVRNLKSGVVQ